MNERPIQALMEIKTFGSVCSGIEAASFVLRPIGVRALWLSEIDGYPCRFLAARYPDVPNVGDMNGIPEMMANGDIDAPDLLCGGTPCQAFSLAGWRAGISDDRGQLTLKFFDILNGIDAKRLARGQQRAVCLWENVEGVLTDGDNAFGCFLAGLAGLDAPMESPLGKRTKRTKRDGKAVTVEVAARWPDAGVLHGPVRNVAWRVLDAKYFGLPQQRRRIYVVAGGKEFCPESVLFETGGLQSDPFKAKPSIGDGQLPLFEGLQADGGAQAQADKSLERVINGSHVEVYRTYTDCLYAAYGTKWNGNAAALNGSLFVCQDGRLRRLTPIEAERIMGFPDDYTLLPGCKDTQRYRAAGNSWAVNVVRWIARRLCSCDALPQLALPAAAARQGRRYVLYILESFVPLADGSYINASAMPYDCTTANMLDFVDTNADSKFYISPAGCAGILRRKEEHNLRINPRLEAALQRCSAGGVGRAV